MRRILGLALFFLGVGIVIALIVPKCFMIALVAAMCLLIGYNLFCGC